MDYEARTRIMFIDIGEINDIEEKFVIFIGDGTGF